MTETFKAQQAVRLGRLASRETIRFSDPFWQELTSTDLCKVEPAALVSVIRPYSSRLALNTAFTGHYAKLVLHCVEQLRSLIGRSDATQQQLRQACNSMLLLRSVTACLFAETPPVELSSLFLVSPSEQLTRDVLGSLTAACLDYIASGYTSAKHYTVMLAVLEVSISLSALQLYWPDACAPGLNTPLEALHAQHQHCQSTVQQLVQIFIDHPRPPRGSLPPVAADATPATVASTVSSITSGLYSMVFSDSGPAVGSIGPLVQLAVMFLLLLLHHPAPTVPQHKATFREAFADMRNSEASGIDDAEAGKLSSASHVAVSFQALFDTLIAHIAEPCVLLLLYNLLNGCPAFLAFVLVRSDIDALLVPLLRQEYELSPNMPHQAYMLQIIFLILSQDEGLARSIHKVRLARVPWYTERNLASITLGSLLFIVLLRAAHRNLTGARDIYLHTNTLAALANFAPYAVHLNSHATHRLLMVIDTGYKRLEKLAAKPQVGQEGEVVTEFVRSVIEVLDSMIFHALGKNPELVYSLLHRQDVVSRLSADPLWRDRLHNAHVVLQHFNAQIDAAQSEAMARERRQEADWSVHRVMEIINGQLMSWKASKLVQPPELKYVYEEASGAEGFFLPYVWAMVVACPYLAFVADRVQLTHAGSHEAS